jgi:hypothetical protein
LEEAGSSETLVKALSITEDLRTASLGHHDRPRHIVLDPTVVISIFYKAFMFLALQREL